jgi:hypothetical protein
MTTITFVLTRETLFAGGPFKKTEVFRANAIAEVIDHLEKHSIWKRVNIINDTSAMHVSGYLFISDPPEQSDHRWWFNLEGFQSTAITDLTASSYEVVEYRDGKDGAVVFTGALNDATTHWRERWLAVFLAERSGDDHHEATSSEQGFTDMVDSYIELYEEDGQNDEFPIYKLRPVVEAA